MWLNRVYKANIGRSIRCAKFLIYVILIEELWVSLLLRGIRGVPEATPIAPLLFLGSRMTGNIASVGRNRGGGGG